MALTDRLSVARRGVAAVLLVLVTLTVGLAAAAQSDPRLAGLFEKLRATDNPAEAKTVELAIWQMWTEAGYPATDSLMQLGLAAMQTRDMGGALPRVAAAPARSPDS